MIGCFRVGCCGLISRRGSEPDLGFKRFWGCWLSWGWGCLRSDVVHGHGTVADTGWSPMLLGYPFVVRSHLH
eukprot:gene12270-biopygen16263